MDTGDYRIEVITTRNKRDGIYFPLGWREINLTEETKQILLIEMSSTMFKDNNNDADLGLMKYSNSDGKIFDLRIKIKIQGKGDEFMFLYFYKYEDFQKYRLAILRNNMY